MHNNNNKYIQTTKLILQTKFNFTSETKDKLLKNREILEQVLTLESILVLSWCS